MDIIHMSADRLKRQLISTRIVMLFVLMIFIYSFVNEPIADAVREVGEVSGVCYGISFFQPFVCLNNSVILNLLMPLFYLMMTAGLSDVQNFDLFIHIRTNRKRFILSQLLSVTVLAAVMVVGLLAVSGLMVGRDMDLSFEYCGAVTRYGTYFPQSTGKYVLTLIPANLYYQESFAMALVHSALLSFLEFILIGVFLLFFSVINHGFIGLLVQVITLSLSAVFVYADSTAKWIFPTAHTTIWLHKNALLEAEVFPMYLSYLYFLGLIALLVILIFVFLKKYECARNM